MSNAFILLVEDNPDDQALTLRVLKQHISNEVVIAHDGAEALQFLFPPEGPLPQVVLLDLNLPKLSGIEVLQRIRQHDSTKLLPVIILSSSDEEKKIVESHGLGVNGYVRKPVQFAELYEAVQVLGLRLILVNKSVRAGDELW
jgi:two-component system response regulator